MMDALKEAFELYKKTRDLEKKKKRLLSKNMDYVFLEHIINEAENKNVEIEITLADHTKMVVRQKPKTKDASFGEMYCGD